MGGAVTRALQLGLIYSFGPCLELKYQRPVGAPCCIRVQLGAAQPRELFFHRLAWSHRRALAARSSARHKFTYNP